jgi:hypothetical protein
MTTQPADLAAPTFEELAPDGYGDKGARFRLTYDNPNGAGTFSIVCRLGAGPRSINAKALEPYGHRDQMTDPPRLYLTGRSEELDGYTEGRRAYRDPLNFAGVPYRVDLYAERPTDSDGAAWAPPSGFYPRVQRAAWHTIAPAVALATMDDDPTDKARAWAWDFARRWYADVAEILDEWPEIILVAVDAARVALIASADAVIADAATRAAYAEAVKAEAAALVGLS